MIADLLILSVAALVWFAFGKWIGLFAVLMAGVGITARHLLEIQREGTRADWRSEEGLW